MWKTGYTNGYMWEVKVYDNPSQFGIDGGRISKLFIRRVSDNRIVVNYDRGWDVKLRLVTRDFLRVKKLYNKLVEQYN